MGGRGSGSAMSGGSGRATLAKIDRTGFKNEGGGQWTLDIPGGGGAQILDESDSSAGGYGRMKAYSVRVWDSNYNMIGDTDIYGSLNDAKSVAKERLKGALMVGRV